MEIRFFGDKEVEWLIFIRSRNFVKMKLIQIYVLISSLFWGIIVQAQQSQSSDTLLIKTKYLDEIVLSDTRLPIKRSQSGKTVIRIDEKEIKQFNGRNLAELLASQAGVIVLGSRSISGQNLRIGVRGSTNNQVLILLDGVRVSDPSRISNDFDLNFLNLQDIASVEILKGGASTLYGSAAAAAVVNISTKKNIEKNRFHLGLTTGTEQAQNQGFNRLNFRSAQLNYSEKTTNFDYSIGASSLFSNGLSAVDNGSEKDDFLRFSLNAHIGNTGERFSWKLRASRAGIENDYDNIFPIEDADFKALSFFETISLDSSYNYSKGSVSLNAGHQTTDREYIDNYPMMYAAVNASVEVVNKLTLTDKLYSVQGILFQEMSYEAVPTTNQKDVFANLVYISSNGFNTSLGARAIDHQSFGSNFTYSINPSYIFSVQDTQLKILGSVSSAFIAPSLFQLYDPFSGNAALLPEETTSYELGTEWAKKKGNASLVFFKRKEDPKIIYDLNTFAYANAPSNIVYQGAEFSYANQLFSALDFKVNYTFTELKEGTLFRLPKHAVNSSLTIDLGKNDSMGLIYAFRGKRQEVNQLQLSAYSLVDLRYAKECYNKELVITLWVTNLLDTDYRELNGFTTKGRNFRLGITYQL